MGAEMKRAMRAFAAIGLGVGLLCAAPAVAVAANAYGQTFAGQEKCLSCHGAKTGRWQVGAYPTTVHGQFISSIDVTRGALIPAASFWPSSTFAGGISFAATDIRWMLGAPGQNHQYVTRHLNSGTVKLDSGSSVAAVAGPADDYLMPNGVEWIADPGVWENPSKPSVRTYFQSCGGCHFLGVTRPTDKTYTLANGATIGRQTATTFVGPGIQCEQCHGTGSTNPDTRHWDTGVAVTRTKQVLKSQTCGQCHVNGTAKEKNYVGGTFSSANGFTTDKNLSDFYIVNGASYIQTSPASVPPTIPLSDTRFYPNGSTKNMKHSHYNEYQLTAHARSLRWANGELWSPRAKDSCLKCHSGEAFLKATSYATDSVNDITLAPSSVASDTLNIECAVCHQIHGRTGEPLGLRISAEELCQKCHTASLAVGKPAEAGSKIHHPQAEMRTGYGLIGVAAPRSWMAEAACPACHMPKTYSNRASHSFKVMLPGDAAAWNVQKGGDSCTPCHGGTSRAALQGRIDGWQDSVKSNVAAAKLGIASAEKRAAATTARGKAAIAAANTNLSFVEADGSWGVHNFPYALAGTVEARTLARSVGARLGALSVAGSGRSVSVNGSLRFGDGTAGAGQTIVIEARPAGATRWTRVASPTCDSAGRFSAAVAPSRTTAYRARWIPASSVVFVSNTYTFVR